MQNLSQEQFNDEMFDAYQHLINFDYKRVFSITRPWANSFPDFRSCLEEKEDGWYQVRKAWCPENYGFNAIHLQVPAAGTTVQITFAGLTPAGQDYNIQSPEKQAGVMVSSESPQQDRQSGAKYTKTVKEKSVSKPPKTNL